MLGANEIKSRGEEGRGSAWRRLPMIATPRQGGTGTARRRLPTIATPVAWMAPASAWRPTDNVKKTTLIYEGGKEAGILVSVPTFERKGGGDEGLRSASSPSCHRWRGRGPVVDVHNPVRMPTGGPADRVPLHFLISRYEICNDVRRSPAL